MATTFDTVLIRHTAESEAALDAVETHAHLTGRLDESNEAKIANLLSDLMYLCDENGIDFESLVDHAEAEFRVDSIIPFIG